MCNTGYLLFIGKLYIFVWDESLSKNKNNEKNADSAVNYDSSVSHNN